MLHVYSKYEVQSFPIANYIKSFELHNTKMKINEANDKQQNEKKLLKISRFLHKQGGDVSASFPQPRMN